MFREYQRLGSDSGSGSRIRTISGASRDSELLGRANGEIVENAPSEEMAPSTVIELCVDEPSSLSTHAENEGKDGEEVQNKGGDERDGGRDHASVAVSNILLRAEEEEKQEEERQAQQQDNQAGSQGGEKDIASCDNHVTAATEGNDGDTVPKEKPTVPVEGVEGGDAEKSEEAGAEREAAEAPESTKEDAKTEGTNDVKQTAGEDDTHKESGPTEEDRVQNQDPDSSETAKESTVVLSREDSAEQGNSEVSNYQETSTAGASILNEDLVDVSSVSDAVKVSDDSMEESSFVSASAPAGEDDEDGDDEDEDGAQSKVAESATSQSDGPPESGPTDERKEMKEGSEKSGDQKGEEKAMVENKEAHPATGTTQDPVVDPVTSEITAEAVSAEPVTSEEPTAEPVTSGGTTTDPQTSKEEKGDASTANTEEGEGSDSQRPAAEPGKEQAEGTTAKTKEIKIARLDVSSVATDTERLELKEASTSVWQD